VSQGTVGNLESGQRVEPSAKTLRGLARALGVNVDWLADETGPKYLPGHPRNKRSASRAAYDVNMISPSDATQLKAMGDSMVHPTGARSIPEGGEVIIDPDVEPKHSEIVLVRQRKGDDPVLRVYWLDGLKPWLRAWNEPTYPRIEMTKETEVLGVAIEVIPVRHSLRP